MGRPSKRATKIRKVDEFDLARLRLLLRAPLSPNNVYSWSLESIRSARNEQMVGRFKLPVRMAKAMRTDDALFTAYRNRLAPARCIGIELEPAKDSPKAKSIAVEGNALFGPQGIAVKTDTLASINGTLANHGIAIGALAHHAREDGSRVDFELKEWPLEFVRWDPVRCCLVTQIELTQDAEPELDAYREAGFLGGHEVPIVHGDGRWVVFTKHEIEPWNQEACILSAALVWARHAFAARDWARGSTAHGNAKVVGELPAGMALQGSDGALTNEARAFLELLQGIASLEAPAGIRPAGSKTDYLVNSSTAWQVWLELMNNAEKAAARIYLGTDGILGAQGGAPGVDIAQLFGVATTIVQGDLECIERALLTGVIEPWCALNFGDSTLAPRRVYLIPDADADKERESYAKRCAAFHDEIKSRRDGGFIVDQETVDRLAAKFGLEAPKLAPATDRTAQIQLAPTDAAVVVLGKEARAAQNLSTFADAVGSADPRDNMTIHEIKAAAEAKPPPVTAAPPPTSGPEVPPPPA